MPKKKKQKTKHSTGGKELSQAEIWDDSALIRSWNDAVAEYEYYHSIHARGEDVEEILRKAEMGELDDDDNNDTDVDPGGQAASGQWRPVHTEAPARPTAPDGNENADTAPQDTRSESGEVEDGECMSSHEDGHGGKSHNLEQRRKAAMDQFQSMLGEERGQQDHPPQSTMGQPSTTTATTAPTMGPSLPPATAITTGQAATPISSPDQTLENIKMAYYWAGYYSGLYDGQRQAQGQVQAQAPAENQHGTQAQPPEGATLGQR
ncbi:uncharacterized protein Z520_08905 [Fonsecaea multimorphosa CBS 102226]|uniref:Survival Motor Neuron Gemin2-binding domain-containing protein n=1 Tax=Fonsecaea multimorphosa CBS 102226 TaxID=1442371 RepID=A0A0D2KFD6_9EURO|nr:uncharacterized protein Z520_08905 [Fonsecaea multimorphosa CBS 102226]KIX95388.1 hypothetical protein Z520_08905 [Fonsecaea multimorphosa CBS 102226]OAL21054.1 hypothetical protein AYO22_08338 [Fonsecaea multimorphosa]